MLRKSKQFFNIWVINHIIRTQTQKVNVNDGRLQKVMNHILNPVLLSTEHLSFFPKYVSH